MSANQITLVVGGFPALAEALTWTNTFERVVYLESTSDFRDHLRGDLKGLGPDKLVFCFADQLRVDTNQTLEFLLSSMSRLNYKILLLKTSALADSIVTAVPSLSLLDGPFRLNDVLGALAGMQVPGIQPVEGLTGSQVIDIRGTFTPAVAPQAPAPPAFFTPKPTAPQAPVPKSVAPQNPTPAPPPFFSQPPAAKPSQPAQEESPQAPTPPSIFAPRPTAPEPVQEEAPRSIPSIFSNPTPAPTGPIADRFGPAPGGGLAPRKHSGYSPAYDAPERLGKVISFASRKGGVGKTTTAANLATYLALRLRNTGKTVCLVDANMQQSDIGLLFNENSPTIYNLTEEKVRTPQTIQRYLVNRQDLNISLLLGPNKITETNPAIITPELYFETVKALRSSFDYIVLDCPVAELFLKMYTDFILPSTDILVDVVIPNFQTLFDNHQWLTALSESPARSGLGFDVEKIWVMLNREEEGVDLPKEDVWNTMSKWRKAGYIPETQAWKKANNNTELIATKGHEDLNYSFSTILFNVTGDPHLRPEEPTQSGSSGGFLSRFRKKR